jgi:pimeloyl-ACP methyl ester carboxylesterase
VGHSLGGGVALQYAGAFPEKVGRLVSIEGLGGLGWSRGVRRPAHVRMRDWVESMRKMEVRQLHTYPDIETARSRMVDANAHLSPSLARHLTIEGVREVPGGYTWKFDNFTHAGSPYEFNMEDARDLWNQVRCPLLILWGEESWGRRFPNGLDLSAFHNYRSARIEKAGHWVHHDQFETFMSIVNGFLAE